VIVLKDTFYVKTQKNPNIILQTVIPWQGYGEAHRVCRFFPVAIEPGLQ